MLSLVYLRTFILSQTLVLTSLYTAGRDENSFPDASEFQPWRWERDQSGKLACVRRASSTIPYSLGARNCVGQKIANLQMHCMLSQVLLHDYLSIMSLRLRFANITTCLFVCEKYWYFLLKVI